MVELDSDTEDRVRALVRLDGFGDAYLFVGRFVDAKVLGFMERTQTMVAEYQRMQSERSGIQITSALIFMIVALLLAVRIGLDRLGAGQSAGGADQPTDHCRQPGAQRRPSGPGARGGPGYATSSCMLSRAFNRMTTQLDSQRRELIQANQQLDERSRFTETVLAGVSAGVIGTDAEPPDRAAEPGGAGLPRRGRPGADRSTPSTRSLPGVAATDRRGGPASRARSSSGSSPCFAGGASGRSWSVWRRSATAAARRATSSPSTTSPSLLSAQRQAAWAEVARRIAHEVKNPLTPIRLSAERLERKYLKQISEDRESFTNSIATIIRQVDTIGRLISEFSAFARMPAPVLREENRGRARARRRVPAAIGVAADPVYGRIAAQAGPAALRRPKSVPGADKSVAEQHQCVV